MALVPHLPCRDSNLHMQAYVVQLAEPGAAAFVFRGSITDDNFETDGCYKLVNFTGGGDASVPGQVHKVCDLCQDTEQMRL